MIWLHFLAKHEPDLLTTTARCNCNVTLETNDIMGVPNCKQQHVIYNTHIHCNYINSKYFTLNLHLTTLLANALERSTSVLWSNFLRRPAGSSVIPHEQYYADRQNHTRYVNTCNIRPMALLYIIHQYQ